MGKILLKNILLGNRPSDILIDGERIAAVGACGETGAPVPADCEVVDCTSKAALPGFVNMHTHAAMSMMRGIGEDIAFHDWLDRI